MRYYKPLRYPKRLIVSDSIFWWQMNQAKLLQIRAWQGEAVNRIMIETGFSKRKCYRLLDELDSMNDFWDSRGNKLNKTEEGQNEQTTDMGLAGDLPTNAGR